MLRGADESEEDFPGGHPAPPGLCSPEPRQLPKMLSAGDMIIPGGEEGGEFCGLEILSTKKRKVNCFRCKWRNAIPRGRVWELSR